MATVPRVAKVDPVRHDPSPTPMIVDLQQAVASYLALDENVIWSGRPRQGLMLRSAELFFIPFSLLWCGFAIFWEASVITEGGPTFFAVFGVPFVLIGLYMVFGRFFVDARNRARTVYAVTNQRVIVVAVSSKSTCRSALLGQVTDITLSEKAAGRGTITFGPEHHAFAWPGSASWPGSTDGTPLRFEAIEDARSVYELVRRYQRVAEIGVGKTG